MSGGASASADDGDACMEIVPLTQLQDLVDFNAVSRPSGVCARVWWVRARVWGVVAVVGACMCEVRGRAWACVCACVVVSVSCAR